MNSKRIVTVVDMDLVASLEKKVADTKFKDRNKEPTIYRVPNILKEVDPQAYEPSLVSLGPYHCDKTHLQAMNQLKWKCLKFILEKNFSVTLVEYVHLIKNLEMQARDAYSEEVKMSSDNFVELMLLDGCFVMLTIMEWNSKSSTNISEESTLWTQFEVVHDIFMLENQVPFFLLETLYKSAFPNRDPFEFRNLTLEFIRMHTLSNFEHPSKDVTFHHIIHLFHSCIDPTRKNEDDNLSTTFGFLRRSKLVKTAVSVPPILYSSLLSQVNKICSAQDANPENLHAHESQKGNPKLDHRVLEFPWIPSATVLNEAGIHLEINKRAKSFLDITFHNGKLHIPKLQIDDITNPILRNLIAYEQCSMSTKFHVSSYAKLMDYIINTAEDVELLQKDEIIISSLGDSQEVATLFNKLPMHVAIRWKNAYFFEAISAMLKKRNTRCSKWRAVLNRDYFGNPWAVISLVGALVLFVLTVMQTIYAVLSYAPSRK